MVIPTKFGLIVLSQIRYDALNLDSVYESGVLLSIVLMDNGVLNSYDN